MEKHDFNEKEVEIRGEKEYKVWQSPKYKESKEKAIEMIDSKKYDLKDGDFWILQNMTKSGKIAYTGLIISHNGCLKINDKLENAVKPNCFTIDKDGYNHSLVYTYCDDDTYEVGEFSSTNGQNAYPYAMAFKRCFDRVVLKKSKLAYSGIYSEVEAEEFKQKQAEEDLIKAKLINQIQQLIVETETDYDKFKAHYKVNDITDMEIEQLEDGLKMLEKKVVKNG